MAYIPLVLIVVILAWFVAAYNKLVRFRNQIKNAWHQIDVQLKRRYDLIPNLVEVVKDYMAYEQETLTKVIEARGAALSAKGPAAQAKAEGFLTETLKSLFAVVEKYPELKANQNVASLQEELTGTENKISFARQFYNDSVMTYNNTIQSIPTNFIASFFNFAQEAYFEIEPESRAVPKASAVARNLAWRRGTARRARSAAASTVPGGRCCLCRGCSSASRPGQPPRSSTRWKRVRRRFLAPRRPVLPCGRSRCCSSPRRRGTMSGCPPPSSSCSPSSSSSNRDRGRLRGPADGARLARAVRHPRGDGVLQRLLDRAVDPRARKRAGKSTGSCATSSRRWRSRPACRPRRCTIPAAGMNASRRAAPGRGERRRHDRFDRLSREELQGVIAHEPPISRAGTRCTTSARPSSSGPSPSCPTYLRGLSRRAFSGSAGRRPGNAAFFVLALLLGPRPAGGEDPR